MSLARPVAHERHYLESVKFFHYLEALLNQFEERYVQPVEPRRNNPYLLHLPGLSVLLVPHRGVRGQFFFLPPKPGSRQAPEGAYDDAHVAPGYGAAPEFYGRQGWSAKNLAAVSKSKDVRFSVFCGDPASDSILILSRPRNALTDPNSYSSPPHSVTQSVEYTFSPSEGVKHTLHALVTFVLPQMPQPRREGERAAVFAASEAAGGAGGGGRPWLV
ncbi:hypothetical protein JCM6882_001235 [Rhodosporidiobolus microsporus]